MLLINIVCGSNLGGLMLLDCPRLYFYADTTFHSNFTEEKRCMQLPPHFHFLAKNLLILSLISAHFLYSNNTTAMYSCRGYTVAVAPPATFIKSMDCLFAVPLPPPEWKVSVCAIISIA